MTSRSSVRMAWTLFGAAATCLTINVVLAVLNTTGPQPVSAAMAIAACAFYLVMFTFAAVGLLIALRRPGNAIGWLMLAIGITWELPSEELVRYGIVTAPGSVPWPTSSRFCPGRCGCPESA